MSDRTCVSRRQILLSGGLAATVPLLASARPAASLVRRPDVAGAPPPEQVHVQLGADAATQIAVSWAAPAAVSRPRLRVGLHGGASGREVPAQERVYTEALTGETVYTYHAAVGSLPPDTAFGYEVVHEGAGPVAGTFRTGPRGRGKGFRFTSFGDQSIPAPVGLGLGPNTPNAGYIVDAVDALDPLFHLVNGDLCYANVSDAPVATWTSFFTNNMRSARYRPWMPAAGNHENEVGNGAQGYRAYQTTTEPAPWSAYRDLATPYGFASFDVAPAEPGGTGSITVTHYGPAVGSRVYAPLDRFVMRKPVGARRPRQLVTG